MVMEQRFLPQTNDVSATGEPAVSVSTSDAFEDEAQETETVSDNEVEASALPALLENEGRMRRRDTSIAGGWMLAYFGTMAVALEQAGRDPASLLVRFGISCAIMSALGIGASAVTARNGRRRKARLVDAVSKSRSVAHVPALVRALLAVSHEVRHVTAEVLIELLPALTAGDAGILGNEERRILLHYLAISPGDAGYRALPELFSRKAYQRELNLRLAIVKALEQVGGAGELPAMERLARGLPTMKSASPVPDDLKAAALECLPFLRQRADEKRAEEQLLRASSASSLPNDTLLLPASAQSDAAPELLLRPGDKSG